METEQSSYFNVQIEGNVQAKQVAIGNNILQIGSIHGGILNVMQPGTAPKLTSKALPIFIRPRRVRDFHGRDREWQQARRALMAAEPKHLEVYGGPQSGKSTFLRFIAHDTQLVEKFSDGLIYKRAQGQQAEDIAQFIFDAFYVFESPIPVKPTAAQLRQALQSVEVLLLLDDFEVEWNDVDNLLDLVPEGLFVLAGNRPQLVGQEFESIHLETLSEKQVTPQSLQVLSREEKRILLTMAAFGGRPLPVERLNRLTDIVDTRPFLERLETRDKVEQLVDGRYRLTNHMSASLAAGGPLSTGSIEKAKDEIRQRTLTEEFFNQAPVSLADWDMIQYLLEWAGNNPVYIVDAVIPLCRQLQAVLAVARRWRAWGEVLRYGLQAARQLGDAPAEAWFRHQLGTTAFMTALATTNPAQVPQLQAEAIDQLESALNMRQALQDRAGAAVTRNQLNHIRGYWTNVSEGGKSVKAESAATGETIAVAGSKILGSLPPTAIF